MNREQALTRLRELWPEATDFVLDGPEDGHYEYQVVAEFVGGSARWGNGDSWEYAIHRAENQEPPS